MLPTDDPSNLEGSSAEKVSLPQPVPRLWRWVSYLVFYPLIVAVTVFFGVLSLICGLWDKDGSQQHWMARQWGRTMLRVTMSPVTMEHGERLGTGPGVYACNHLSYFDTPAIYARLPFQFRILAKAPLWKIPVIGWYLERSGQVSVDQSTARSGVASLMRGVRTVQGGLSLAIFPEGGRAFNGELQPMLAGAAFIAIKAQVPLVPMTLVGTYELLPIHVYTMRPRPLKLIVGEPLSTAGLTGRDAEALTARLMAVIHETYVAHHG